LTMPMIYRAGSLTIGAHDEQSQRQRGQAAHISADH
jgi:hypothetical protein